MIKEMLVLDPNVEIVPVLQAPKFNPDLPICRFHFKIPPKAENGILLVHHWVDRGEPVYEPAVIMEIEIGLVNVPGNDDHSRNGREVPIPHRALLPSEKWIRDPTMGSIWTLNTDISRGQISDSTSSGLAEVLAVAKRVEDKLDILLSRG